MRLTKKCSGPALLCGRSLAEIGKVIIGQNYLVERLVIGLLANGHVLLEGVPGLAKTLGRQVAGAIV